MDFHVLEGLIFDFLQYDDSIYVTTTVEASLLPNICDFEVITDSTFPEIPFGLFFSNTTPEWFKPDDSLMLELGSHYDHALKRYTSPTNCLRFNPNIGLNLTQMKTVFCILAVGFFAAFISLFLELSQKLTETSKAPKNRFDKTYYVTNVVDGEGSETWVCINHRLEKDFYVKKDEQNEEWVCFQLLQNH